MPLSASTLVKSYYVEQGQLLVRSNIESEQEPSLSLVLSGGGARGLAHIGVLRALEEHEVPIDLIVGSSMGSVIGGLYAAGYTPDQIENIVKSIDWPDIFRDETARGTLFLGQKGEQDRYLLSIRFKNFQPYIPVSISPGQKVLTILSDLFLRAYYQPRGDFDNLRIPFRAVATDVVSGKRVVLGDGNLAESINGSLAIPLLFSPVAIDSMLLFDGGLLSNMPVDVAKDMGADITLAVNITSKLRPRSEMNAPWEIADQVTTIMADPVNSLQEDKADVIIQPLLEDFLNTDFDHIDTMIEAGYRAAIAKMDTLKQLIQEKRYRISYNYRISNVSLPEEFVDEHQYLSRQLQLTKNKIVSLADISGDLDRLLACGCYARVAAHLTGVDSALHVELDLDPFPVLDSIDIRGNRSLSREELLSAMRLRPGMLIHADSLRHDFEAITKRYRTFGFSLMNLEEAGLNLDTGLLSIVIDEGVIGKIKIEGNKETQRFVIKREIELRPGDVFNWKKVNKSIENIYATQLFDRVSADIVPKGDETQLHIKVEEKSSIRMQIGGKLDNERRAQSYIEFGDDNFMGGGIKTTLLTRFGLRDGLISVNVRNDRIFTTFLTFTLQGYYSWQINHITGGGQSGRYRERRYGARFQIGQQLRRIGQLAAELRIEKARDRSYSGTFTLEQDLELRTFSLHSITDKRDRIDFPTSGIYNNWIWESGSKLLLNSQESYTRAALNLEGYYTLRKNHTWHIRVMAGVGDETLPFSETYRLGGLHSFFGILENQYYGRQIVLMNGEYRLKLPVDFMNGTYLGGRFDFGGIWEKPELLFDAEDFFTGIGGYLAFDTILGPLYMAYGQMSAGRSAVYLSLGFNF